MNSVGSSSCLHTHMPIRYASVRGGKTLPSTVARVEGAASVAMPAVKSRRTTSASGAGRSVACFSEQAPDSIKPSKNASRLHTQRSMPLHETLSINRSILFVFRSPYERGNPAAGKGTSNPVRPLCEGPQRFGYWMVPEVSPASIQSVMVAEGTICVPMNVSVTRWLTPAPPAVTCGSELVRSTEVL